MTTHDPVRPSFAVLDLETTGFSHYDRIVEIGVVLCDPSGAVEGAWDSLVQPDRDIPNSEIHGITATDVVAAPRFAEIAGDLAGLLAGRVLVAHNANFDHRFLLEEFERADFPVGSAAGDVFDTMDWAGQLLPGGPHKLADCVRVLGLHNEWAHCALGDAAVTAELLRNMIGLMSPAELNTLHGLRGFGFWPVPAPSGRSLSRTGGLESLASGTAGPEREECVAGSWIDRIAAELPEGTDADVAAYRRLLTAALVDDRLSASEIEQLVAAAAHHGLDRDDVAEIHRQFLRQLAVSAWADGNVDAAECDQMLTVAEQLGVPRAEIEPLLEAPVTGEAAARLVLNHGDRVTFTGSLDLPRAEWEARASASGLVVAGIARKTVVLVAGNPDSMSGKARRARELGVPIVDEATFATFLRALDATEPDEGAEADGEAAAETAAAEVAEAIETVEEAVAALDWPGFDGPVSGSVPELASQWLSRCADQPLSTMSPLLEPAVLPETVAPGSSVALRWLSSFPVPLEATVEDVAALRGVGKVTLRAIVESLVQEAVDAGGDDSLVDESWPFSGSIYEEAEAGDDGVAAEDLATLALWRALCTEAVGAVEHGISEPAPVAAARAALAGDLRYGDPLSLVASRLSDEWMQLLREDERYPVIVGERLLSGATLQQVGTMVGVTRERVRQLERALREHAAGKLPVTDMVAAATAGFGPVVPAAQVVEAWPFAGQPSLFEGYTWLEVIARLRGAWVAVEDYLVEPTFPRRLDAEAAERSDEFGVVGLYALAGALHTAPDDLAGYLVTEETSGRYLVVDDHVLTRTSSYGDRAAAVLSLFGESATPEEILAVLGSGNKVSLTNAMSSDERIHRINKNRYALVEWGGEEFTSIADWISRQIDAHGGQAPVAELVAAAPRLEVAENSVRAFIASPEFHVEDGMVSRNEEVTVDADPQETAGLYLRDGLWQQLVTVTADHLRGSGSNLARCYVSFLDVPFLGSVELESEAGPVSVYFNRVNVSVGSLRAVFTARGAVEGDRFWLVIDPQERTLRVDPAPPRRDGLSGEAELRNVVGLDAAGGSTLEEVNTMLDLAPDAPRRKTVARFNHRHQEDLAALVAELGR